MGPCQIRNPNISSRLLILWYSSAKEELQASTNPLFFEATELIPFLIIAIVSIAITVGI